MASFVDFELDSYENNYDLIFENGDIKITNELNTSILVSLLCDRRAADSEVLLPQYRRGWIGNEQLFNNLDEFGSKLWLLDQAKMNNLSLSRAKSYTTQALQWFITNELNLVDNIEVSTEFIELDKIKIDIKLNKDSKTINEFTMMNS